MFRDGELVGCVVTFVDITQRRQAEEELRRSEKMAALGKLSAGLAHELNNPATAAGRASSQLLDALNELQIAPIELTRVGADHALWMSLSRWEQEIQRRSAEPIGLSPLEASDREEDLLDWLTTQGITDCWDIASTFAKAGLMCPDLDEIAADLPPHTLEKR